MNTGLVNPSYFDQVQARPFWILLCVHVRGFFFSVVLLQAVTIYIIIHHIYVTFSRSLFIGMQRVRPVSTTFCRFEMI